MSQLNKKRRIPIQVLLARYEKALNAQQINTPIPLKRRYTHYQGQLTRAEKARRAIEKAQEPKKRSTLRADRAWVDHIFREPSEYLPVIVTRYPDGSHVAYLSNKKKDA